MGRRGSTFFAACDDPGSPDGGEQIDNGEVQRAIRTVAVRPKNSVFAGSDAGGEKAATLSTIITSSTLAGVNPWEHSRDVVDETANGWPNKRLDERPLSHWTPPGAASVALAA